MTAAVKALLTFRWANKLSELTGVLSAVALLVATVVTVEAVAVRYFLGEPTVWQGELTIYLMMFVAFVGAAYGLKHDAHVGVDLLVERLGQRPKLIVRIITALICLGVVAAVGWTAFQNWADAYERGFRTATAWRAPLAVVYAILPLGMLAVGLQYLAMIIEGVQGLLGKVPLSKVALLGSAGEKAALEKELGLVAADPAAGDGEAGEVGEVGETGPGDDAVGPGDDAVGPGDDTVDGHGRDEGRAR